MSLFNKIKKSKETSENKFNKEEIIKEILDNKDEKVPGWKFFRVSNYVMGVGIPNTFEFIDTLNCDFIAIYNTKINREISFKGNPFSEYKKIVESEYQIVREIYIYDKDDENIVCRLDDKNIAIILPFHIYETITANSAKELFVKLKREQE